MSTWVATYLSPPRARPKESEGTRSQFEAGVRPVGYVAPHPLPSQARRLPGGSACVPPTRRAAEGETALPDECPRTVGRSLGGVQGQEMWACVSRAGELLPHRHPYLGGFECAAVGSLQYPPGPGTLPPFPHKQASTGVEGLDSVVLPAEAPRCSSLHSRNSMGRHCKSLLPTPAQESRAQLDKLASHLPSPPSGVAA